MIAEIKIEMFMRNQSGQSTSLMLILSLVLMLTIIFVFNTSKLLSERQQAKMLADQAFMQLQHVRLVF